MGRTRLTGIAAALAVAGALALAACGGDDDSGGSGVSNEGNSELFTTSGFTEALDAVKEKAGDDAGVLQLQITEGGANFKLRDGEQATGYVYTGGEVVDEDVDIIGSGSLEGQDFPISDIDPAAIDLMVRGAREASGIDNLEVTVLTLEKRPTDGELGWVINGEGDGRTGLVFNADLDGTNVVDPVDAATDAAGQAAQDAADAAGAAGGSGSGSSGSSSADQAIQDAQATAQCIQEAAGDVNKIQACTQ